MEENLGNAPPIKLNENLGDAPPIEEQLLLFNGPFNAQDLDALINVIYLSFNEHNSPENDYQSPPGDNNGNEMN